MINKQYILHIFGFFHTSLILFAQPGSLDTPFNTNSGTGANGDIYNIEIQPDQKIIIGGSFTNYNSFADGYIDRILPNGNIDGTYIVGTGCNSWVNEIKVLSDGKIAIAGDFSTLQGLSREKIAILNSDGTVYNSFNSSGTNFWINDIIEVEPNKIMVGGDFTVLQGFPNPYLGILLTDGSLDVGNDIGVGPNNIVRGITKSADRAFIFGDFTSYDGISIKHVAKIYLNGTFDSSFSPGNGFNNTIQDLQIQSDGKILVGGDFTNYDGLACNGIIRLHSNGTVDLGFNIGTAFNNQVRSMAVQADGKIVIVGNFSSYNGIARNRIARLNPDGTLDTNFDPGLGFNDLVYDVKIDADGNIIVAGSFNSYNGASVGHIVKLNGAALLIDEFENNTTSHLYPNPCSTNFSINTTDIIEEVNIYNPSGQLVYQGKTKNIDLKNSESGIYIVHIKTNQNCWTEKLEVQ